MHAPTVKNEISWTTLLAAVGLLMTLGGIIWAAGQFNATMDASQKYSTQARQQLQNEITATNRALDNTRSDIGDLQALGPKFDNLAYRLTVQEQGSAQLSKAIEDLKKNLSDQGADIKVIREILTRLDAKDRAK